MPGLRYPEVMRGKRFTIAFEDLHDRLEVFARTTDSTLVRENEEHVMREWSDEGDSVETKESEESGEGEEVEGWEEGESDGEYVGRGGGGAFDRAAEAAVLCRAKSTA